MCVGHIHSPSPISFQINIPSFLTQFCAISPSLHQGQSVMPKYSQTYNPSSPRNYKLPIAAWLDIEFHSRSLFQAVIRSGLSLCKSLACCHNCSVLIRTLPSCVQKTTTSDSRPLDTDSTIQKCS